MLSRYVTHYYESLRKRNSDVTTMNRKHSMKVKLHRAESLVSCAAARLCQFRVQSVPQQEKLDSSGLSNCTVANCWHRTSITRLNKWCYVINKFYIANKWRELLLSFASKNSVKFTCVNFLTVTALPDDNENYIVYCLWIHSCLELVAISHVNVGGLVPCWKMLCSLKVNCCVLMVMWMVQSVRGWSTCSMFPVCSCADAGSLLP